MEPWLNPLYDADGMRAIDRWAIEERGVPSLELMEAAGREVATAVGDLAPDGPIRVLCGKGNNAGDGLVAARYLAEAGHEVEALLLWPAGELSGDAAANLARFAAAAFGGRPRGAAGRLGGGRRRDLRDRVLGRSARARRGGDRGDRPQRGAGRRLRHRLRGRRLERRGGGARGRGGDHGQLPRTKARPPDRAGQAAHRRAPGRPDRDPRRRPVGPGRGGDRGGCPRARSGEGPAVDQVQLGPGDDRRRVAGPDRRCPDVVAGGDPGRGRLRDRRRTRRPRGRLRGGPARGDVRRAAREATASWPRPRRRRFWAPSSGLPPVSSGLVSVAIPPRSSWRGR